MSGEIRILIANGHPIFRIGLRALIETESGFKLAGEAIDGEQAVSLTQKLKPDVLLLDTVMPKIGGMDVLKGLAASPVRTNTVIFTAAIEDQEIIEALKLGARGVIMKDTPMPLLVKGIRCIAAGEFWVGRGNVQGLVHALQNSHSKPADDPAQRFALTGREVEVLTAIVDGYSNKDIAKRFSISEQTVKHHLSRIFAKVGVSNRLELALFSMQNQLTEKRP